VRVLFTKKKAQCKDPAGRLQLPRLEQCHNDALTEAVVASKLQSYGFHVAFPLKIRLYGAYSSIQLLSCKTV